MKTNKFKIGDIVKHSSGSIANGIYGQIVLDPCHNNELSVQDNENALDMPVKNHEHELTVVGNIKTHSHLLKLWK